MKRVEPKQIIIETTSRCNLKCKLCPTLDDKHIARDMEDDLFFSIIDRVVREGLNSVVIPWMNGEPLLHPKYATYLSYLSKFDIPHYVTTNGMIYNKDVFAEILDGASSCYQLIFSLDGLPDPISPSIEVARPGTNRHQVLETIRKVSEWKKDVGSTVDLAVKICRRGQDWEEIENFIAYWLNNPAIDYVCVGDALEITNPESMRVYPCQYFDNNFMVIRSRGRVVMCAYNLEAVNNPRFSMGDVRNGTPLLDVYNNQLFTMMREEQNKHRFGPPCDTCGFAYTGQGFQGIVQFRDEQSGLHKPVFYHRDYYNQFFSLKQKLKDEDYYKRGFTL
jgi:radical SAM protein with 4Fe4S-binding SPASM domain